MKVSNTWEQCTLNYYLEGLGNLLSMYSITDNGVQKLTQKVAFLFNCKLMIFPLVNKTIFVKYSGYPSMHVYIVLASDLFRVLSGNR